MCSLADQLRLASASRSLVEARFQPPPEACQRLLCTNKRQHPISNKSNNSSLPAATQARFWIRVDYQNRSWARFWIKHAASTSLVEAIGQPLSPHASPHSSCYARPAVPAQIAALRIKEPSSRPEEVLTSATLERGS
ncbi:hypothetical protein Bbelb_340250 [Branchiostoma belcheri]|nr:hypothetical protein Bbelb_340250 [Branchiostoma belcheri]